VLLGIPLGNTLKTYRTYWEQRKNEKKIPPAPHPKNLKEKNQGTLNAW
jgi:hypothetical protein